MGKGVRKLQEYGGMSSGNTTNTKETVAGIYTSMNRISI
jgi:hypothetical protein